MFISKITIHIYFWFRPFTSAAKIYWKKHKYVLTLSPQHYLPPKSGFISTIAPALYQNTIIHPLINIYARRPRLFTPRKLIPKRVISKHTLRAPPCPRTYTYLPVPSHYCIYPPPPNQNKSSSHVDEFTPPKRKQQQQRYINPPSCT